MASECWWKLGSTLNILSFQGNVRQFNGCPCIDPRANPIPGASPGLAGPLPSGPLPSGPISVPIPVPSGAGFPSGAGLPPGAGLPSGAGLPPGAIPQIRPARFEQAPVLFSRLSREALAQSKP